MMLDDTLSSEYSLAEYIHHFKLKIEHKFAKLNGEIFQLFWELVYWTMNRF